MSRDAVLECARAGREGGLAAGVAAALRGVDVAGAVPDSIAAVPDGPSRPAGEVVDHPLTRAQGIVLVRLPGGGNGPAAAVVAGRLAAARLGLSQTALNAASRHLAGRTAAGGGPVLREQLVLGSVADALVEIEVLLQQAVLLDRSPETGTAVELHEGITRLDWSTAMLFGAAGWTTDPHGATLLASAFVADCWTPREEGPWN